MTYYPTRQSYDRLSGVQTDFFKMTDLTLSYTISLSLVHARNNEIYLKEIEIYEILQKRRTYISVKSGVSRGISYTRICYEYK